MSQKNLTSLLKICLFILLGNSCSQEIDDKALSLYREAIQQYEMHNLPHALESFQQIVNLYPQFHQAHFMCGKTLYFLEKFPESAECFASIIEREPQFSQARIWLARSLFTAGAWKEGESILLEQINYDPHDPRTLRLLANIKAKQGETAASLAYLKESKLFAQEFVLTYLDLAKFYYQNGLPQRALGELVSASALLETEDPLTNSINSFITQIQEEFP